MTDRYTHVGLFDERAAIETFIPDYSLPSSKANNIATGTDDFTLEPDDCNKPDNKQGDGHHNEDSQDIQIKEVTNKTDCTDKGFLIRRPQVRILPGVFL